METPGQRDARCLIEKIGREHTLSGAIKGTRFELLVNNCLEILSSQLYEKSTHFLLELIQNADDNNYDSPSPTLSFSYKPGSLRIDCNEVGFTAENVEAICAISRSTKSGKTSDGEYIGEKGIGFKSVFKASDVVWISSREFTFKFDKREFLGMVTPIWADFPESTRPGYTSIYLQLSEGYEEETLIRELLTFDTNLLIFLRRIQEIKIRVSRPDAIDEPVWEKKIRKTESQQDADRVTVLDTGMSTFQYLIRTHVIKDLPNEHKRPGWRQTKILLAFPIADPPEQPRLIPQNVYAFLPIRNYGLKFLLQGDFLLTASRENIESTLPWNRTIRDALADAFLLSVDHFNKGKLKYTWPYYLPSASTAAFSFFEPAITSILTQLKESPVLESCAGTMVKASSLKHVPLDQFGDKDGIPFTLSSYTADGYLSLKYPAWAIEGTNSIGVSELSPQEFLADLDAAITQDPITFRTKPSTWHSQLAETLIRLSTNAELMSLIQDICLIPLQDGNWISAQGQSMFFSKSETRLEIPSGIEVSIVDSSAESDPNRRKLFTTLGVKAWEAPEICRLIVRVHESANFDPKRLAVEQLISHAAFLYNASWQPPKTVDLWFATMQDERCLGRKLYIPGSSEMNSPPARIFAQLQKKFAVIHNDYLKAFASSPDWPAWLVSNLGLSKVPRLVTPHVEPKLQPTQPTLALENPRLSPSIMTNQAGQPGIDPILENVLKDSDFAFYGKLLPNEQDIASVSKPELIVTNKMLNPKLTDYQTELMLLEQKNKKTLLMARQEQDSLRPSPIPSLATAQGQPESTVPSSTLLPTGTTPTQLHHMAAAPGQQQAILEADPQTLTPKASRSPKPDLDNQCGVRLPNGGSCGRSLTCKSHSMQAKRAVSGRSGPFDALLSGYHEANRRKVQVASIREQFSPAIGSTARITPQQNLEAVYAEENQAAAQMTAAFFSEDQMSRASRSPGPPSPTYNSGMGYDIDPNKQCGVPLPNGSFCPLPITCEMHKLKDKRGVPNRSEPLMVLIDNYRKQEQQNREAGSRIDERLTMDKRAHAAAKGVWITVDASPNKTFLANCKECRSGKQYGADHNVLEHLRRTHFHPSKVRVTPLDLKTRWIKEIQVNSSGPLTTDQDALDVLDQISRSSEPTSSDGGPANSPTHPSRGKPAGSLRTREGRPKKGRKRKNSLSDSYPEGLIPTPPLAQVSDTEDTFALSEEFTFMFRECHSSDILQLLKDNWHYYSQWIDGVHMKWQDPSFLDSSLQLKSKIGACLVQSAKGSLPLQDTVLPTIDRQLDEGRLIPAVEITDPQHPEWTLLNYFGVIMKPDIHYYLRCLIAISDEPVPDVDNVAYIYEQIQARYKDNEELISAAFRERDIILVHLESPRSTKPASWTNMKECISRDIAIGSEYPTSSYLFRCLISPAGDPIAPIVATASLITHSTKLDDISRFFRDISTALRDVNTSRAAQLLRPLQSKHIFPVTNGPGKSTHDNLLELHNTSWFIADKPLIRESFHGKVPLLALPIEDLPALQDLFRVLRLDRRMLSKLATNRTQAKGRHSTHWAYTASLRAKAPFIKALVPHSDHNMMTIIRQIDEVRVSIAVEILQTFMFNPAGTEIQGNPVRGQVCLSDTGHLLNILMTEECAAAQCPPYELVSLIADTFAIKDPNLFSLLFTALSGSSMESIYSTFTQQGISIKGLVFGKSKNRYRAQRADLMRIPSPFWGSVNRMGSSYRGSSDVMTFNSFRRGETLHSYNADRRLPMMQITEEIHSRRLVLDDERIDGWDHIQYLGEHMISKALQARLGQAYNPETNWTSHLRSRSGHRPFHSLTICAAFTIQDPKILGEMTDFVTQYGQSQTPKWKETLEANPPVYHLDVIVSEGSKTSSFAITSSQVERMRHHRMHGNAYHENTDVSVLVRVSDVYSKDLLSVEFFVDPWQLFDSNELTLENGWVFKGVIQKDLVGPTRKKRKLNGPPISWVMPALPAIHQANMTKFDARKDDETFAHRPLDSGNIRLLYLLPGKPRDRLQGMIIHVPYRSPGTYQALSYVWGTSTRTSELMTPNGILWITLSLNKALRGLRNKAKAIMLWVDAICINQKDNKEKAQQIRLLPNIFQSAAATYAFIEGHKGSDEAIEMLMQVRAKAELGEIPKNEACPEDEAEWGIEDDSDHELDPGEGMETNNKMTSKVWSSLDRWPADLPRVPACWEGEPIPPLDNPIWTSVAAVFTLSWFRRVWIIQEIVAAQNVKIVCGKWIIDWNDLYLAMEVVDRQIQLLEHDSSALKATWEPFLSLAAQREWEARQHRWTLILLLENFRHSESTLSRDRLFALLGLASDGNEASFEPDYDSPLEAIVLKFARVFVRQGRGMQLLYRAGLNQQSDKFASWIPDWTVRRPGSLHDSSEGGVMFTACGPQQAKIKCVPDTDELLVDGYLVDVIESISTTSNVEQEWGDYFREIDTMVDNAVLSLVRDSREDLKWKVPIAGVLYPKVAVSGGLDLQSSYAALRNYLNSKQKGETKETNDYLANGPPLVSMYSTALEHIATSALQEQSASYMAALGDTLHGWKFVITKRGYVGVVPNIASVGDVVVILKGGRVPFVLHASETRFGALRLVGECYIHSIMNGEGLLLPGVAESKFRLH
ncbi:hypothetical protein P154DRAFT_607356 [Amniculicola lignicola CBS 123094]|uniref:SCA7 domain-containing protein n=1 Tax=Amniculicola lignicola CBS 123094 TaxID=1392246 RepID=A0A6A5W758_9PLEO|nr:hypothetical protein P154DRAFT_607356 [Amniculicola lignicola CBS 123094]